MRMVMVPLLAVVTACSGGGTVDSTEVVCDDFAAFVKDGAPAGQRDQVVDDIGEVIDNADEGVRNAYDGIKTGGATADDVFAQACFDAGWDG